MFISIIITYTHQCFLFIPNISPSLTPYNIYNNKRTNPNAFHNVEQVHLVVERYSQPFHVFFL